MEADRIKTVNLDGVKVIRHGMKPSAFSQVAPQRKPPWLRVRLPDAAGPWAKVRQTVQQHSLHTVCQEALCPNLPECWGRGTATFMLLGSACTRACRFCAVDTGNPRGRIDEREPEQTAQAVALMRLKYVVLTSVNRDDLPDGGSGHFARTIAAIRRCSPQTQVEALVPDFQGDAQAVQTVAQSGLLVFAHNLETVERLTPQVRDPRATYAQSLQVLQQARHSGEELMTKSSLMLGLGETDDEILVALRDLRSAGVRALTLGQYLRPTRNHLPVQRWVRPEAFDDYRQRALQMGFVFASCGPMTRSSYRAEEILQVLPGAEVVTDEVI